MSDSHAAFVWDAREIAVATTLAASLGVLIGVGGVLPPALAVGAVLIVLAAAARPDRAILFVALSNYLPVKQSVSETVNIQAAEVMLVLVLAGWLLWAARRRSVTLDPDPLLWAIVLALAASAALSLIYSPEPAVSLFGVIRTIELNVVLLFLVLTTVHTVDSVWWLFWGWIAVAGFEATVGVYQFLSQTGAYVGGTFTRAIGTVHRSSWLDLAISLGIALCLVVGDLLVRRKGGWWRYPLAALLALGILATYTRGVWLAVLFALAAMLVAMRPQALVLLVLAVALMVGVVTANPRSDLASRVISTTDPNDPSVVQRLFLWETAINIFRHYPVLGSGPKTFPELRDRYAVPGLEIYSYHDTPGESIKVELLGPHNFYLLALSERGVVGLATFLALLLLLLVRGVRTAHATGDPRLRAAVVGLSGALLFMATHAMVGDLFVGSMGPAAAALMALLAAATCARCSMSAEPAQDARASTGALP